MYQVELETSVSYLKSFLWRVQAQNLSASVKNTVSLKGEVHPKYGIHICHFYNIVQLSLWHESHFLFKLNCRETVCTDDVIVRHTGSR